MIELRVRVIEVRSRGGSGIRFGVKSTKSTKEPVKEKFERIYCHWPGVKARVKIRIKIRF